jgi:dihydrolipoamide dehydrogenase
VALVERERVGGTCLNWGCIPTKALIASAELCHGAKNAAALGVSVQTVSPDYGAIWKRKNDVVCKLRGGVETLLKGNGVKVFEGSGSFVARDRIAVKGPAGETQIGASRAIVATGSESAVPGFVPASRRVVESRAFLDLKALPPTLIVLGGGVIGCEFACMAAQLGAKVTVVELLEDILPALDRDVRQALRRHMEEALGISVLTGKPMTDIRAGREGVAGKFGDEALGAEMLLVSVGRKPVTAGLQAGRAGVAVTDRGTIPVDDCCRTAAATVFAVGDVTEGSTLLAHAATAQGLAAAETAATGKQVRAERLIPACIYTSPEIGSVGVGEDRARADGRNVRVGKFHFAALGRAMAAGDTTGFVKWVADADTDRLLGAHAVGPRATELVAEAAAAIRAELTLEEIGRTVHCHPTFSEAWMEAAHAAHGLCIHAAPKRRR